MEQVGYHTFFTLAEAKELAAQKHLSCRRALAAASARSAVRPCVSHGTALELQGMAATMNYRPDYDPQLIHVAVDRRQDLRSVKGMKYHYCHQGMDAIAADETVSACSAQQAVCQIAQYTDLESLVIAMDWMTCANDALRVCTHQELADYIDGLGKFVGRPLCRKAIAMSKQGTDSPQETVLRLGCDAFGLPDAKVNYEVFDHIRGSGSLRVDIAYPDDHVCIEYDGGYHYTRNRWEFDLDKRNRLKDLGMMPFVATRRTLATETSRRDFFSMVARAIGEYRREGSFTSSVWGF